MFVTSGIHMKTYLLKSKGNAWEVLDKYAHNIRDPNPLITDNAGEETGSEWNRVIKNYLI
jgi:hypothetical protein